MASSRSTSFAAAITTAARIKPSLADGSDGPPRAKRRDVRLSVRPQAIAESHSTVSLPLA
jgi:hypothetical protein